MLWKCDIDDEWCTTFIRAPCGSDDDDDHHHYDDDDDDDDDGKGWGGEGKGAAPGGRGGRLP